MVATATAVGIALPLVRIALKIKHKQCVVAGSKTPLLCTVGTPFGLPPPISVIPVIKREKTFKQVFNEQRDAFTEGLLESGIDTDKVFEVGGSALKKYAQGKKTEQILKSVSKSLK
jgi:hypothetical protein